MALLDNLFISRRRTAFLDNRRAALLYIYTMTQQRIEKCWIHDGGQARSGREN